MDDFHHYQYGHYPGGTYYAVNTFFRVFQAAVPAPSGGYPQRTVGASQPDEDLIAGVMAAFDSAHGPATVAAADRLAAASTSTFTEQQYRNMVSILTVLRLLWH